MSALLLLTAATASAGSITPSCQARTVVFEEVEDLTDKVEIAADSSELFMKNELLIFSGNVQMRHSQQSVAADEVRYSRKLNQATATGDVQLRQAGFEVDAESAAVDINTRTATLQKISYRIPEVGGQGEASSASEKHRYRQGKWRRQGGRRAAIIQGCDVSGASRVLLSTRRQSQKRLPDSKNRLL